MNVCSVYYQWGYGLLRGKYFSALVLRTCVSGGEFEVAGAFAVSGLYAWAMGRKGVVERKLDEAVARSEAMAAKAVRFGPERRERVLGGMRRGLRPYAAAKAAGVSSETLRRTRKADPVFDEACVLAEQEWLEQIEGKLIEAAEAREPWAIQMLLKSRGRETWGDKREVSVTVSGTVEVEAGERLSRIAALEARLAERADLIGPAVGLPAVAVSGLEVLEAEIVEESELGLEPEAP